MGVKLEVVSPPSEGGPERTDDDLMRLARAGASGAFATLVRRHQAQTLRLCYRYLGDAALAQDAAQNTLVELYRYLPKYQPLGQFPAFLRRIALNQCRMAARARPRSIPATTEPTVESAEVELLRAERQREVARAVAQLPKRHRVVLALRFGGDLSYQEIAETAGIPIGTVRSRLFDGLKKLRRKMGGTP